MAKHVRQQIREAAKLALTGLPTTGDRVYSGDPFAKDAADGPNLYVAVPGEVADGGLDNLGPAGGRRLTLLIIAKAEAILIEDVLDAMALEVEAVIEGQRFGGLAKNTVFVGASKSVEDEGRKRSGEVRIEFAVTYRIRAGEPATAIA
jgi:hypothetical protein